MRLPALLLVSVVACAQPMLTATEPANLYPLKQEIKAYVETGEYEREISKVAGEAGAWLEQRVRQAGGSKKLAAIFDVDETLLSNLPHMRRMDFGYVPADWDAWVNEGDAPGLAPVCDLFRTARRLGVAVFVLSGRRESDRPATEKNLRAAGVSDYAALNFKPDEPAQTTESFKTAERKKIAADNFTIVLNLGDQESDLAGGFAERTFKLPNPFYLTR